MLCHSKLLANERLVQTPVRNRRDRPTLGTPSLRGEKREMTVPRRVRSIGCRESPEAVEVMKQPMCTACIPPRSQRNGRRVVCAREGLQQKLYHPSVIDDGVPRLRTCSLGAHYSKRGDEGAEL